MPEGILNYAGTNWLALTLWAGDESGASLAGLELSVDAVIQSGYVKPALSPMPAWSLRPGAY